MTLVQVRAAAIVSIAFAFNACGLLSPREDPTRFVILASVDELPDGAEERSSASSPTLARIGLGPVTLPDYVQRAEIVARVDGTRIVPSTTERWGELLQRGVERVLTTDVARILGAKSVVLHPWYATDKPDAQIQIAFTRFEREGPRSVVLDARWTIRNLALSGPAIEGEAHIVRPTRDDAGTGAASALSFALADLCREIAAAWPRAGFEAPPR